jgi:hypothetical protein
MVQAAQAAAVRVRIQEAIMEPLTLEVAEVAEDITAQLGRHQMAQVVLAS